MELKKSPKANLENKKTLFTEIGLIVALAVVLVAFEHKTREKAVSTLEEEVYIPVEEEIIPITQETPPPKPDMPKIPQLSDEIDRRHHHQHRRHSRHGCPGDGLRRRSRRRGD